jgi:hypothetical protein
LPRLFSSGWCILHAYFLCFPPSPAVYYTCKANHEKVRPVTDAKQVRHVRHLIDPFPLRAGQGDWNGDRSKEAAFRFRDSPWPVRNCEHSSAVAWRPASEWILHHSATARVNRSNRPKTPLFPVRLLLGGACSIALDARELTAWLPPRPTPSQVNKFHVIHQQNSILKFGFDRVQKFSIR